MSLKLENKVAVITGVNAKGTFCTVQKAFPLLKDNGAIVLVGSSFWFKGFPQYVTYGATNAAI